MRCLILCLLCSTYSGVALAEARAELPPLDSDVRRFVDDRGCVFHKKTIGGWAIWVQDIQARGAPNCLAKPRPVKAQARGKTA